MTIVAAPHSASIATAAAAAAHRRLASREGQPAPGCGSLASRMCLPLALAVAWAPRAGSRVPDDPVGMRPPRTARRYGSDRSNHGHGHGGITGEQPPRLFREAPGTGGSFAALETPGLRVRDIRVGARPQR
jgi:hypothetical protein